MTTGVLIQNGAFLIIDMDTFKVGEYYAKRDVWPDFPDSEFFQCIEIQPQPVFKRIKKEDIPDGVTPIRFKCDWGD